VDGGAHYAMIMCGQGLPRVPLITTSLRGTTAGSSCEKMLLWTRQAVCGEAVSQAVGRLPGCLSWPQDTQESQ
jgi:hypothetical protein